MICRLSEMKSQPTTKALVFRIALILYIVAVAYLCFANLNRIPDVPKHLFGLEMDKIVHFCMFFPFPVLGFLSYGHKSESIWHSIAVIVTICALGAIFAGLTEIIQGMLPRRTEDIRDYKADLLAIGISSFIMFLIDIRNVRK